MSRIKFADQIEVSLCDDCAAVNIELWRDGRVFAVAVPVDPSEFARDLAEAIALSTARQGGGRPGHSH